MGMKAHVCTDCDLVRVTWEYDNVTVFKKALSTITTDIENMLTEDFNFLFENVLFEYIRLGLKGPIEKEQQERSIQVTVTNTFCTIVMPKPLRLHALFVFLGQPDMQFFCAEMKCCPWQSH